MRCPTHHSTGPAHVCGDETRSLPEKTIIFKIQFSKTLCMTSQETKNRRLKESQLERAKALAGIDASDPSIEIPPGAEIADQSALAHNNTYGRLPRFYVDKVVVCRQCKTEEVWPAGRQKWWYEVAKGNINTDAVLCRSCREKEKARKNEARTTHLSGLGKKDGDHET
jgi:hypothetical protein